MYPELKNNLYGVHAYINILEHLLLDENYTLASKAPPGAVHPYRLRNQSFLWQRTHGQNEYTARCE